ncbi:MAG TPA: serine/threonine-protein kinase [Polyangiaceae bacterium]|nr:serine/threonine-protein kinase [Polyangiaceae bacterium]
MPIGTVLEGKFRVTQEIGRGGMAAVYEAVNVDIGKRVAVKILSAELITSRVVRERFIREARAAAAIHSPYICEVYDSGMFHDRPFLVMELLEGESLYDRMTRVRQLKPSTTLKIVRHVVKGLTKAHEAGVVHRDLKPENIFLTRDAEGRMLAKIVDFGLAKFYESRGGDEERNVRLTREGALFGTPAYMSPEQARGQGEVDYRADLWALACIVYECLTGRTVWDVQQGVAMILAQIARGQLPDVLQYRPDLPPAFDEWFRRALHPELEKRFQTARAFMETLELSLAGSGDGMPSSPDPMLGLDGLPSAQISSIAIPSPDLQGNAPPPSVRGGSSGRAITWLVVAATAVLSVYGFWLFVLHPTPETAEAATQVADAPSSDPEGDERPLSERGPGAELIAQAQLAFRRDQHAEGLAGLRTARGENPNVAGSLLAHSEIAVTPTGPCQMAGLGRPRPFDVSAPASHARIALSKDGLLMSWSDAHQDPKRRNVYMTLLDDAFRRVGPVRNVTPEATSAIYPDLQRFGDGFALLYWDSGSREPGVYVRSLEADGRIRSPARLVSTDRKDQYFPSFLGLPGGEFLALWSEQRPGALPDLVMRRLDRELAPGDALLALTSLKKGDASQPTADVFGNKLYVTYRYKDPSGQNEIRLLRIALDDPVLRTGLATDSTIQQAGEVVVVRAAPKQAEPSVSCGERGCLIVWDDEAAGANAAWVPHDAQAPLWHRDFSSSGRRPVIARSPKGATAVAYFAGDRLFISPIDAEGVGKPSVISRVSGFQPAPHLIPGSTPGEWLIAWRDFEAGHLEVFVARAQCTGTDHR